MCSSWRLESQASRLMQQDMVDFLKEAEDAIWSLPHRQVHVDSLLTSMADAVDIGYVAK
ncbi:hypothetical protein ABBQ38_010795 [Trebouxia sp. C0009 RCD-2024]